MSIQTIYSALRSKRFILLWLVCIWQINHCKATVLDSLVIHMSMDETFNQLMIEECYYLAEGESFDDGHRVVFHKSIDAYPFLYQRLTSEQLVNSKGEEFEIDRYGYGYERTYLDFKAPVSSNELHLKYTILHPFSANNVLKHEFRFYDFNYRAKQIIIYFHCSNGYSLETNTWELGYHYYESLDASMYSISPLNYRLRFYFDNTESTYFEPTLKAKFQFNQPVKLEAPSSYLDEWKIQGGNMIWVVAILLILSIILRFLSVSFYANAVRIYGLIIFLILIYAGAPMVIFGWKANGWSHHFLNELFVQLSYVIFFGIFAYSIHQDLKSLNARSYYAVLAFPFLVIILALHASISPILYLTIPIAFFPFIFWFQPANARYLGAKYFELVEIVDSNGQISFDELSSLSQLPIERIVAIVQRLPSHPILVDHENKIFLSISAYELIKKYQICTNCGASTVIEQEDLVSCSHCHTNYRDSQQKEPTNPVPDMVLLCSHIIRNLIYLVYLFFGLLGIVFISDLLFNGDLVENSFAFIFYGFLLYKLIQFLEQQTADMLNGKSMLIIGLLLPFFFLISPIFILYKFLKSPRVQLYFDTNMAKKMEKFIRSKGSCSLSEFAAHFNIYREQALEITNYLCGNNLIEVVYDIEKSMLIHRHIWQKLSGANSCQQCGGLVQIKNDHSTCMFCGDITSL